MRGLLAIYRKELADHFSSYRFVILFALIAMVSFIISYMAGINMREDLEGMAKPKFVFLVLFNTRGALFSMVQFVAFFGPLIGVVLGFDAISHERANGTLIKVVSQPIYRDAVINGKFLAGVTTITIMLLSIVLVISGIGLKLLGVVPGIEEILRLFIYLIISIFYISFWLGMAILFSIAFRSIATSALVSGALWIFMILIIPIAAQVVADMFFPADQKGQIKNDQIQESVSLLSPTTLYSNAAATIIDPTRNTTRDSDLMGMGRVERISAAIFQGPLPLGESLFVVFPHIVALLAITLICFAISYLMFMLQEIRT